MFRLRERTWDAFRHHAIQDFEHRMGVHLRKFYPAACATSGDEPLRELIRYGVERARGHGITNERAVCIYIDVMFAFGREFDVDPALPWASALLSRKDVPSERALAHRLFARAMEHLGEARGLYAEVAR